MTLLPSGHTAPGAWSRGVLRPGKWRPLRLIAWGIGLIGLVIGGAALSGFLFRRLAPAHAEPAKLLHGEIIVACAVAIYILAVRFIERRKVTEFAPQRAVPELILGLGCGFGLMSAVMLMLVAGGGYTLAGPHASPLWHGLGLSLGSGVIEELLFRGVVFRLLWGALGLAWALCLSAALFGLLHLLNPGHNILGAVSIIVEAGVLLAAFYAVTGRLFASIGTHIAWNLTQGYVFGASVSGTDFGPSLYTATQVPAPPYC